MEHKTTKWNAVSPVRLKHQEGDCRRLGVFLAILHNREFALLALKELKRGEISRNF
jgi:hypothetical protein